MPPTCVALGNADPKTYKISMLLSTDRLLDPSYRKALRLDPDDFGLTLNLAEMDILGQIKTMMAPNAAELRAKHYKLNVYASLALLVYLKRCSGSACVHVMHIVRAIASQIPMISLSPHSCGKSPVTGLLHTRG